MAFPTSWTITKSWIVTSPVSGSTSSRASWAEAQRLGVSRTTWRDEYHRGVAELLAKGAG